MAGATVNIHHVPPPSVRPFERIGHRGAPRELPENSLEGFLRALERGADAVELDVHATHDGVCVVHHDAELARHLATPLAGRPIVSLTWSELQRVEIAPRVCVPSLDEVLRAIGSRAMVYVEIKGHGIEKSVVEVIARAGTRCAVHSFDHDVIARVARLAPTLRRGILFDERPVDVRHAMIAASAADVWPHWKLIDETLAHVIHESRGRVIAWTVNELSAAEHLLAMGIDGICTDDLRALSPLT